MAFYDVHAFVCTHGKRCPGDGDAAGVHRALKKMAAEAGLGRVRINQSGCLGQCGHGPMLVIYPDGVWYHALTVEKAERIFREHVVGGCVVEEYRFHPEASSEG